MKEFKLKTKWANFIYIFVPILILLMLMLTINTISEGGFSEDNILVICILTIFISFFIYLLISTAKSKIIIDNNKIISKGVFLIKELNLKEIKGYRTINNYLIIEPLNENKKRILIPKDFSGVYEIIMWLDEKVPDLNEKEEEQLIDDILNNDKFRLSRDERLSNLINAKKIEKILTIISSLVFAWILFYPHPYMYAMISGMVLPIVIVIFYIQLKGLIRFTHINKYGAEFSFLSSALLSGILFVRVTINYNIIWNYNIFLYVFIICSFFLIIILRNKIEFNTKKKRISGALLLLIFLIPYSFGSVVFINCYFDNPTSHVYTADIIEKSTGSRKNRTTYHFELSPWGNIKTEKEKIEVTEDMYNKFENGDKVKIYYSDGLLNIPCYEISVEKVE